MKKIRVTVEWTGGQKTVQVVTYFTDLDLALSLKKIWDSLGVRPVRLVAEFI